MTADVSILIPAYQAESFIDQTLLFARGQTHRDVHILVSLDKGEDNTSTLVKAHAAADARVTLFEQSARLGWAGNVNFLLDQASTPYCFIYFHDDIILPQYVEKLMAALVRAPDAAMAHCDVRYFGGSEAVLPGRDNQGPTPARLMKFMLAPHRGAPLRGLMRRDIIGGVRLPDDQQRSLWANETYLLELIALGSNVALPEVLYLNWAGRPAGVVASWSDADADGAFGALKAVFQRAVAVLDRTARSEEERKAYQFAAYLWMMRFIQDVERRAKRRLFAHPRELHPVFNPRDWPRSLDEYGPEITAWTAPRWASVQADLTDRGAL